MLPFGKVMCAMDRCGPWAGSALSRFSTAAALVLIAGSALVTDVNAQDETTTTDVAIGNGGIATATIDGDISIGEIITGENTGNSIVTGDISGPVELNGGEINYPTNVNISQDLGPPIATADGGDEGQVVLPSPPDEISPTIDINIDNRNDNRSDAVAIGTGGAGGGGAPPP